MQANNWGIIVYGWLLLYIYACINNSIIIFYFFQQKVMLAKILNKQFREDIEKKEPKDSSQSETQNTQEVVNDQSNPPSQATNDHIDIKGEEEPEIHTSQSETTPTSQSETTHTNQSETTHTSQSETTDGNVDKNLEECNGEDSEEHNVKKEIDESQEEAMDEDDVLADTPYTITST